MFSIRDSVEPEDGFGDHDIFLTSSHPPATHATPISFDLPSTTSAATQPSSTNVPTQKHKTPKATDSNPPKRRRTVGGDVGSRTYTDDEVWEFTAESPPRTRRSKKMDARSTQNTRKQSNIDEDTPVVTRTTRRNSVNGMDQESVRRTTARRNSRRIHDDSSSPTIPTTIPKKRKPTIQDEDSDTERIDSPSPKPQSLESDDPSSPLITEIYIPLKKVEAEPEIEFEDLLLATKSSSRKSIIAVEIPSKPRRKSRHKTPLEEIVIENLITPETTPQKPNFNANIRQNIPLASHDDPPAEDEVDNVENVIVPPTTPVKRSAQESVEKVGAMMSPPRQLNVASILAKSPNRPMYRVGLSRRVNVEPLHGYLKRNAS
jgi:hypothetical protein